jgi:myo-inositol-1(or 4)-monophosphatase
MTIGCVKSHFSREESNAMQADRQMLIEAEAVCVDAVRAAGTVLREYFRAPLSVEFKEKGEQSPVTEADRRSEDILRTALRRAFPDHGIIGEEDEGVVNAGAEYVWFLDPLDGTTNFTAGLPAFAVSMGLCFQGMPVLGVIAVPGEGPNGTIFRAHQGGGAYCNEVAMQVAAANVPAGTRLMSTPAWILGQYRVRRRSPLWQSNVRCAGSIAYELAYAACGTFQLTVISGARLWDMMAGAVLLQEAGGTVLFCNGKARRWRPWETFVQQALTQPFGQDVKALRQLMVYMLAGNPEVVQRQASRMRLRRLPPLVAKAQRQLRKAWKDAVARFRRRGNG